MPLLLLLVCQHFVTVTDKAMLDLQVTHSQNPGTQLLTLCRDRASNTQYALISPRAALIVGILESRRSAARQLPSAPVAAMADPLARMLAELSADFRKCKVENEDDLLSLPRDDLTQRIALLESLADRVHEARGMALARVKRMSTSTSSPTPPLLPPLPPAFPHRPVSQLSTFSVESAATTSIATTTAPGAAAAPSAAGLLAPTHPLRVLTPNSNILPKPLPLKSLCTANLPPTTSTLCSPRPLRSTRMEMPQLRRLHPLVPPPHSPSQPQTRSSQTLRHTRVTSRTRRPSTTHMRLPGPRWPPSNRPSQRSNWANARASTRRRHCSLSAHRVAP
ncbi:hypothetical protein BCR44DRAFT_1264586 [Catenaria anguillulae PL171]|uniref:Uncharacterized protein n=1 Tax=Catenaria anguillulae PL171 TaxID=765915 RepID=A0A1Y2HCZ1_9FUNG|nr:hypothetical protein BCR44DRAFT_1264586 [Catenaria anguillulae PL171]